MKTFQKRRLGVLEDLYSGTFSILLLPSQVGLQKSHELVLHVAHKTSQKPAW